MSGSPLHGLSGQSVLWFCGDWDRGWRREWSRRGWWHHHWCDGSVCWASLPATVTQGHYCSYIPRGWRSRASETTWKSNGTNERTVGVCVLLYHYRITPLNPTAARRVAWWWSRLETRNKVLEVWVTGLWGRRVNGQHSAILESFHPQTTNGEAGT